MNAERTLEQHAQLISAKASWLMERSARITPDEIRREGLWDLFPSVEGSEDDCVDLYDRIDYDFPDDASCAKFWSTMSLLKRAAGKQNVILPDKDTAMYYSNLADLRELSCVTAEDLRRMCIPTRFPDEFRVRKFYVSSQMAVMWMLVSTCELSVQARSSMLLKMYKDRVTVCRDEATGMRFRVLSVPPGLGKTAMVMGAVTALVRNGMFERMMRTADVWCKQVRSTSGVGAYFSDSSDGAALPRAVVFFVCPENVWGYWHGTVASHIAELSLDECDGSGEMLLYPPTPKEKFFWKKALQVVERADPSDGEKRKAIVVMTPAQFAQFLKEGHNLAWPLTVFDEFSAHCSKFGNCVTPLCREFWAMTATPTEICGAVSGNLKTNPFRGILGDKFARCETHPHELKLRGRTPTQATETLCGNAQVLLLTTIPRGVVEWVTEEVSTLMFDGVALLKRASLGAETFMHKRLIESHASREKLVSRAAEEFLVWDLLEDESVARERRRAIGSGDSEVLTHFRKVDAGALPRGTHERTDSFGQTYVKQSDMGFKRSRIGARNWFKTYVYSWWNGDTVNTLVDLPTVLRMLEDATRTLGFGIARITHCEATRAYHADRSEVEFMRGVHAKLRSKLELLESVARRIDAIPLGGYPRGHPLERDTRRNFALGARPFDKPAQLCSVLVCMNCSCCLTMDDVLSSGWYLDNMRWTANADVNLCDIHSLRCPECYVETVIDEGVRPMCEVFFGRHLAERHGEGYRDVEEMKDAVRRAEGFEFRRCLRGERMYDVDRAFFDLGGAVMLEAVILEAILVRGMRRLVFFADGHAFDGIVGPVFETARRWLFMEGAPKSVARRHLWHGQRHGVSASMTKAENVKWYTDMQARREVRALCLSRDRSVGEETHGMNLAATDAIFFLGRCHNSVQAVSRGLRAGVSAADGDRYLLVYCA
ncbi:hypothetical protein CYMTET_35701 [Cymbomonas tetramitiformis]|uniref:Uncharacterized protein n=1 Tax=Cymbomonas tetramitiformis TaxID=36881 RepID=A0AAE0F8Q9_9CHLO|nr:hypothetical protein CYMTET_35701 [Cymbomonas tetramitiformis]|eukprot:gene267-486_t